MNIVIPEVGKTFDGVKTVVSGLGIVPTLVLAGLALVFLMYAGTGIVNSIQGWNAGREIEGHKRDAAKWEQVATAEKSRADQMTGVAGAYKQTADAATKELTELQNARPELQKRTQAAINRVEAVRNQALKPIDGDMRERVDSLGSDLQRLYPDSQR